MRKGFYMNINSELQTIKNKLSERTFEIRWGVSLEGWVQQQLERIYNELHTQSQSKLL